MLDTACGTWLSLGVLPLTARGPAIPAPPLGSWPPMGGQRGLCDDRQYGYGYTRRNRAETPQMGGGRDATPGARSAHPPSESPRSSMGRASASKAGRPGSIPGGGTQLVDKPVMGGKLRVVTTANQEQQAASTLTPDPPGTTARGHEAPAHRVARRVASPAKDGWVPRPITSPREPEAAVPAHPPTGPQTPMRVAGPAGFHGSGAGPAAPRQEVRWAG